MTTIMMRDTTTSLLCLEALSSNRLRLDNDIPTPLAAARYVFAQRLVYLTFTDLAYTNLSLPHFLIGLDATLAYLLLWCTQHTTQHWIRDELYTHESRVGPETPIWVMVMAVRQRVPKQMTKGTDSEEGDRTRFSAPEAVG